MANDTIEMTADIVAEMKHGFDRSWHDIDREWAHGLADRIEAAAKRERESDERLLFRLMWYDVDDYVSDWACEPYRQTVKDCCARLGITYHHSGREIAEEMDKCKVGVEIAKEVSDE